MHSIKIGKPGFLSKMWGLNPITASLSIFAVNIKNANLSLYDAYHYFHVCNYIVKCGTFWSSPWEDNCRKLCKNEMYLCYNYDFRI